MSLQSSTGREEMFSQQRTLAGGHSGSVSLVFYELVSCELGPRGENDTKSIAQINTCSDVFPGDRPDGRLKVNIVRTKSGHSKMFEMGTRNSELIRAISTHTIQQQPNTNK